MAEQSARDPKRLMYSTRTKYEFQFGYSRAVRQGDVIRVAGTAGLNEAGQVVSDDVVEQMRRALEIVREAIEDLGGTLDDVIMTRIFVSDVRSIDSVAVIHGDVFREIRPASSIVKVEFIDPRILVEVEAEAVCSGKEKK
jgi:enamine deaminase RidA (YjgF/YER057c/UK114 family)